MKNKLIAYALDFTSFLLENAKPERVILFGSAARGQANQDSDIDIFVECDDKDIKVIKNRFLKSERVRKYWALKGVTNDISIVHGKLDEWELKNSVISDGITLYGKFQDTPSGSENKTLISWEGVTPELKRINLYRRLYGYRQKGTRYPGIIEHLGGERVGRGTILIPAAHANEAIEFFRKEKIPISIRTMIEYR